MRPDLRSVWSLRISVGAILLATWQVAGSFSPNVKFALGTPTEVAKELANLLMNQDLLRHSLVTGLAAALGLIAGILAGSAIGLSFWFSEVASNAARPLLLMAANAPVFALAPLLVIWFGVGIALKIALAFYFTFFMAVASTQRQTARSAPDSARLEEVYRVFGGTQRKIFHRVVVPAALDSVLAAMRRSVALALLGAFVGEFIASQEGLGYLILRASRVFNIPQALAAGCAFVALALLLDGLGRLVESYRTELIQLVSVPRVVWSRRNRVGVG